MRRGVFGNALATLAIMTIGVLVALFILDKQRVRFPLLDGDPLRLQAELATAQAVTPGQGQTIQVAGVRIGDIGAVDLEDGRAVVELVIDAEYDDLVHTDARALLRPKTGLKDMFLDLDPGTPEAPLAKEGFAIPVANTLPDVNPDEILAGLDADVRDHVRLLLSGAARGLDGRADDLRAVLRRYEPTHRNLALVNSAVKVRARELRRLVTSLARFNGELARGDEDISELVASASKVFRALASQRDGVAATVRQLPGALRATRLALDEADRLGRVIGPATTRLLPVPAALRRANRATAPFAREAAPLLRDDIRPFVRAARPVVRRLYPAARDLVDAEPGITRSLRTLNHLFNMLAFNPSGREGPDVAGRDEGFLFHLAWLGHQSLNLFTNADANGVFRPIVLVGSCSTLRALANGAAPLDELLLDLTGPLSDSAICGETP